MRLYVLTLEQCEIVRGWRNEWLYSTRTPYRLTAEMQADFYRTVICNRSSPHRYWALMQNGFLGMGGLTDIQWENRIAEISLIVDPTLHRQRIGTEGAELILCEGFSALGLKTIFGECYECNSTETFWRELTLKHGGYVTTLPNRKFWDGRFWDSLYFSIDADAWRKTRSPNQLEYVCPKDGRAKSIPAELCQGCPTRPCKAEEMGVRQRDA